MQASFRGRVENEAIPIRAGLVPAVGCRYQERQRTVLQLVAHLGYTFAVTAAAIVDTLTFKHTILVVPAVIIRLGNRIITDEFNFPHAMRQRQGFGCQKGQLCDHLAEYRLHPVDTGQPAALARPLDLDAV